MSPSQLRRQTITVDSFTRLRDPSDEVELAIAETRAAYALARTQRFVERRVAKTDRRLVSDRRAMADVLDEAFVKSQRNRFDDNGLHSAFEAFR